MRLIFVIILLLTTISLTTSAQTTGKGCNLGNIVYTQYLGMDNAYGGFAQPTYKNPGQSYPINFNGYSATKPNNENYTCDAINYYFGRFDMTFTGLTCVTEQTLHGTVNGNGAEVIYKVNDPTKCNIAPLPLEGNDLILPFIVIMTGVAAYFIRKKKIN